MTTTNEFAAEDRTFYCTRKTAYPIKSMAERDAKSLTDSTGLLITTYHCKFCDKYHVGNTPTREVEAKRMEYKFFVEECGVLLAKIRIHDHHWIYMLPPGTPENEYSVLDNGTLVAYKEGGDFFREKDGLKSTHWQIMSHLLPIYPRDPERLRDRLDEHLGNMGEYNKTMMDILNKVNKEKEEKKRILIRPEKKIEDQEMYKGRAVFRTPDGKPFYRDIVTCSSEMCRNEIELRAYISQDTQGELTYVNKRTPLDGKAIIKPGPGNKGTFPKWICKTCVKDLCLDKTQYQKEFIEEPANTQPYYAKESVLCDLQKIAGDMEIDANFVRGATQMACHILST